MNKVKWVKLSCKILKAISVTATGSLIMAGTNKYVVFGVLLAGALAIAIEEFIENNNIDIK